MTGKNMLIRLLTVIIMLGSAAAVYAADAPKESGVQALTAEQKSREIITMKFKNAEISTVIGFLAKLDGLIVVADDSVKGNISINAPEKLNLEEAYSVVMAVLDVKGFTVIRTEKFLKVVSKKDSVQKPVDISYGSDPADVTSEDRVVTHILPLSHVDATDIQSNIRPLVSSTGNSFVNKEANSVIITDVGSNIKRLLKLVAKLDNPNIATLGKSGISTKVYNVKYMKAKDVSDALSKVFSTEENKGGTGLKITPVESVNDVIVTADSSMHREVSKTIESMDTRNRQVMIEAKIIEVTLSDTFRFGINLSEMLFSVGSADFNVTYGASVANSFATATMSNSDVKSSIEALSSQGDTNILSSPRLLTSDNQKASISVGKEEPILKSTTDVSTDGDGKTVSDYVYKDVGIQMDVTPRINVDRDVSLDIAFTVTDILDEKNFGDVTAPVMGKRQTSTSVIVANGRTVVISGLIENSKRDTENKVPLLGGIPILGWLFKNVEKVNEKTELLIFLTPYVIETPEEAKDLTEQELAVSGKGVAESRDSLQRAEIKSLEVDYLIEMILDRYTDMPCSKK